MNPRSFRFEQAGPVATLRLDRPQAMNALTFEVYRELTDTLRALADRDDVRAVVLTGDRARLLHGRRRARDHRRARWGATRRRSSSSPASPAT